MLARRFTVVCLLVALFGMGMAMLVAEKSRFAPLHAQGGVFQICDGARTIGCLPQYR